MLPQLLVGGLLFADPDQPWDRFRGPNGQGIAESANPPIEFGSEQNLKWRTAVPEGYSSVVVWGDQVFVTGLEDESLVVLNIDGRDGTLRWRKVVTPPITATNYPPDSSHRVASTPAVSAERLIVYAFHLGLIAYDHQGNLVWDKKLPAPETMYWPATSPIIQDGSVYLCLDGGMGGQPEGQPAKPNSSRLYAFAAKDGALLWETARPFGSVSYSTPVIWTREVSGRRLDELVVFGGKRLAGYDLNSGTLNWWVSGFPEISSTVPTLGAGMVFVGATAFIGFSSEQYDGPPWEAFIAYDQNGDGRLALEELPGEFSFESRPELPRATRGYAVFPFKDLAQGQDGNQDGFFAKDEFDNMVKWMEALDRPALMGIRPDRNGDITDSAIVWRAVRGIPEAPSMLHYRDRLYAVKDGGLVTCYRPESGEVIYTERLGAGGLYTASPVAAAGRIYFCSAIGEMTVVEAGDQFKILARAKLDEEVYSTSAVVGSRLYVRALRHLYAFETRSARP